MQSRPYAADLTVPAGTPATAPVSLTVPVPTGHVTRGVLTIPDGPNGLAGWQLLLAGTPIVPYDGESWLIGNDHVYTFPIDQDVNAGQLTVSGYNTGQYPHTFHFFADWIPPGQLPGVTATLATGAAALPATDASVAAITGYAPEEL